MDRDTVIALAHKAEGEALDHGMWMMHVEDLERFATLVAAAEREECAKVCDDFDVCDPKHIADAIRSRTA